MAIDMLPHVIEAAPGQYMDTAAVIAALDKQVDNQYGTGIFDGFGEVSAWFNETNYTTTGQQEIMNITIDDVMEFASEVPMDTPLEARTKISKFVTVTANQFNLPGIALRARDMSTVEATTMEVANQVRKNLYALNLIKYGQALNIMKYGDTSPKYISMYDGEQFYSTNHKLGPNEVPYSNLFDLPFDEAGLNFDTVMRLAFDQIGLGDENSPFPYLPIPSAEYILVVGPKLRVPASKLMFSTADVNDYKNAGVINYFKGRAKLYIENQLGDSEAWYLFMKPALGPMRPFYTYLYRPQGDFRVGKLNLVPLQSQSTIATGMIQWLGLEYVGVNGGFPFLAAKSDPTLSL